MDMLISLFGGEFCSNLVAALLHSLWQGAAIGVLLFLFLRVIPAKEANKRYAAGIVGLSAIVICGFFTLSVLSYEMEVPETISGAESLTVIAEESLLVAESKCVVHAGGTANEARFEGYEVSVDGGWYAWAMGIWLVGVVVMVFRAVCMVIGSGRIRKQCNVLEEGQISGLIEQLRCSMNITRKIRAAVCERIDVPGVIGFIWPTLLLPASVLSGVPVEDMRAVLAHELAHIRRYDYLVNFFQMVVEAVLFFNPAVWWVSRQIRIEREACCDSAAIAATGEGALYAEVLFKWAHQLSAKGGAEFAMAGFPGSEGKRGMADRIRRIVVTGHKPRLRVPWYTIACMLLVSGAVLAGLWQGATMTVAYAGALLTPAERIELMEDIKEEYAPDRKEYGPEDRVTVSGIVITHDGKVINTSNCSGFRGISRSSNETASYSINVKDGAFFQKLRCGKLYLSARIEGYAPAFVGPLVAEPGGVINDVVIFLEEGFAAKLKLVDENGEGIAGAKLVGGYVFHKRVNYNDLEFVTDENGVAEIKHCASHPIKFTVTADGFQYDKKVVELQAEEETVWQLTAADEAAGVVVSSETGELIAGAELTLIHQDDFHLSIGSSDPYRLTVTTTTDEEGRFSLTSIRDNSRYFFLIRADGYETKFPYQISAGKKDIRISLGKELFVSGKIVGDLSLLRTRKGKPVIHYANTFYYEPYSGNSHEQSSEVDIIDGVGYFKITGLWVGPLRISAGCKTAKYQIKDKPLEDIVIDLVPKVAGEYERRAVVLQFDYPEGSPAPQGKVRLHCMDQDVSGHAYSNKVLEVVDGTVSYEILVPGEIGYDNEGIAGYWFDGKSGIKVGEGQEPFVVTISVIPAGSIFGEVFEADGSVASNVMVSVVEAKKSPLREEGSLDVRGKSGASEDEDGVKYVLSPLPFGGKYVAVAHRKGSYVVSDPIAINEDTPIVELNMKMPEGVTLSGRIVDEDGNPISWASYRFEYSTPWGHGFGGGRRKADKDGRFTEEHVNPDVEGDYSITLKDMPGYRPIRLEIENLYEPLEVTIEKAQKVTGVVVDDATGWPIPGVDVYALPQDNSVPEPTGYLDADEVTDEDGRFVFTTMAKREYRLAVRSAKEVGSRSSLLVTGGQQEPVTVRINLSTRSKLKPRKPADVVE